VSRLSVITLALFASTSAAQSTQTGDAAVDREIARIRAVTAKLRKLDDAVAAGYPRTVPNCVAHPEHGGMGYHHIKSALYDAKLEVERPEILVYGYSAKGEYRLNGVEYVVPYTAISRDAEPPVIMGQKLKRADGLQIWYLHVWTGLDNPSGLFADWNPGVRCP
jgi:hypothetical protein